MFIGFAGGGWLAARTSESQAKSDGRLHGLVVWALGSLTLLYLALSTAGMAGILGSITGHTLSLAAGPVFWTLGAGICGLIGGVVGGHVGGYTEAAAATAIRRAA
jgi:hypothetical protein